MTQEYTPDGERGEAKTRIVLTPENFEHSISECMSNWKFCDGPEDPWKLYLYFKHSKNSKANLDLITYLGGQKLTDPMERDTYRDVVKKMIDDYYPREKHIEGEANYYMWTGENEKALRLYLKLRKKDKNLNYDLSIANLYFDLKRFGEALPYYQSEQERLVLDEARDPNQVGALSYIRDRINEINEHLAKDSRR